MKPGTAKPEILLQTVERDDPEVMALYEPFILEADGPLADEIDIGAEVAKGPPADLVPPLGGMLLARVDDEPAAIGGVRHLDTEVAEIKSMYVSPAHRGLGLGRRILDELHRVAAESGCRAVRLDTSDYLTAAIGLYRAAGYREVPDYNQNPKADTWFERDLGR
jgi:ribosomal protein S18 acetylase RimI-like enzyme